MEPLPVVHSEVPSMEMLVKTVVKFEIQVIVSTRIITESNLWSEENSLKCYIAGQTGSTGSERLKVTKSHNIL